MGLRWEHMPERVVTGAFMINSGWGKLRAGEERAAGVHGMASGTYPRFGKVPAGTFVKALGAGEVALGGLLLVPAVPTVVAGAALTAFSGGLLGMYWKTPGMRKEGTPFPTEQGVALAKDSWLAGIGLSLMLGGLRPAARHGRIQEMRARRAGRKAVQEKRKG